VIWAKQFSCIHKAVSSGRKAEPAVIAASRLDASPSGFYNLS
jgi:hypothetical protein